MKELLCKNKIKIVKFIGAIVFLVIIIHIFLALTYLFRGNQYNYYDRISVVGIKEEKENSLDVFILEEVQRLYIGNRYMHIVIVDLHHMIWQQIQFRQRVFWHMSNMLNNTRIQIYM